MFDGQENEQTFIWRHFAICGLWMKFVDCCFIVIIIVYGICGLVAICDVVCGFIMFSVGKFYFCYGE